MSRVAIYARLSKDSERSTSIERQLEACRSFAAARGWVVVAEASDVDVSGSKVSPWQRPSFAPLLQRDDVDVILAMKLDRVGRSVGDLSALVEELRGRDVALVSASEPFDLTTGIGEAMAQIVAVFAQLEARTIGDRVASSIRHRKARGVFTGGPVPFGYRAARLDDGTATLEPDPIEAPVVREAAARVLAGESCYSIVRDLNARGVKPRRAAQWGIASLKRLLRGDAILGRLVDRGEIVRDAEGLPVVAFEPLVELVDVEQLRAKLEPARRGGGRRKASRVASGLLECSGCGGSMSIRSGRDGAKLFTCSLAKNGGGCARPVGISADAVEEYLAGELLARRGDWQLVELVESKRDPVELVELREAIDWTSSELGRSATPELFAQLQELQARREELEQLGSETRREVVETGRTYREEWEARDVAGRRELLDSELDGRVVVLPIARRGTRPPAADRLVVSWRELATD